LLVVVGKSSLDSRNESGQPRRLVVSGAWVRGEVAGAVRAEESAPVTRGIDFGVLFRAQLFIERDADDAAGMGQSPGDIPICNELTDSALVGVSLRLTGSDAIERNHELVQVLQDHNDLVEGHADLSGRHVHQRLQLQISAG
jgi:hypothetical protein